MKRLWIELRSYYWVMRDIFDGIKEAFQLRKVYVEHMTKFSDDEDLTRLWECFMERNTDKDLSVDYSPQYVYTDSFDYTDVKSKEPTLSNRVQIADEDLAYVEAMEEVNKYDIN